ncbi:MAG TPA: aminotransferase DegT, partial [Sulfuricurvum sp.]|nr:aminotransferase DegT [Sulfuricurvum sp.]
GSTGSDITCVSFGPHMKLTSSNGGVLATDDLEMMERASLLRNHGMVKEDESLPYIYDVVEIGNKYTMSPIEAAFNTAFITHQDMAIERQQELAARYNERLKGTHHITLPEVHRDHAFFNYIIKVDKNRDGFARDLLARGIETGLHYIPLHLMSYYKNKYGLRINDFPVALRNYQQILSLPIYASMTDKEVDYVCDTIIELAKNRV